VAPDDPFCAGRSATVWYAFTPTSDMVLRAHTFGSDYDTTLSVYTGSPGNLSQIACNDDALGLQSQVVFTATAGETYYFMVGAFGEGLAGTWSSRSRSSPRSPSTCRSMTGAASRLPMAP
jgi:hypothetical protein